MDGTLFSPSRGLFVFSPVFAFSLYGVYLAIRQRWEMRLSISLVFASLAMWLVICLPGHWWIWDGGWCYGPRLLSDLTPAFIFFLVPVLQRWMEPSKIRWRRFVAVGLFALTVAISCFIHSQGALSEAAYLWNSEPGFESRLWTWDDPQFLRGVWKRPLSSKSNQGGVENPGFEDGNFAPWVPYRSVQFHVSAARAHSGSYSLMETSGEGSVYQDVSGLQPGRVYSIGAWVAASRDATATAQIAVFDPAKNVATFSLAVHPDSVWRQIDDAVTMGPGGNLRIHLFRYQGTGIIYWDDVSVVAIK
jgi:hypothetical protein